MNNYLYDNRDNMRYHLVYQYQFNKVHSLLLMLMDYLKN
jgi:hypothetical protein